MALEELREFLSTSPVWGTTAADALIHHRLRISIHVPRMGDDPREAVVCRGDVDISIHVPRMGDDSRRAKKQTITYYFYPRPPYGGRRRLAGDDEAALKFLSTSPVWGTTLSCTLTYGYLTFLSTSPVWGTTLRCDIIIPQ